MSTEESRNKDGRQNRETFVEDGQRTHEELEDRAGRFDVLSAIVDFAYVFDREGRFIFANKSLLDLWGLKLEEAVGKNFYDLNYEPELAAKLHRQIEHVFQTGELVRDETAYTSPQGKTGFYEYILSPLRGPSGEMQAVVGSTHITTERKKAEEALREREQFVRATLDSFVSMIAILDREGVIVDVNEPWREFGRENGYRAPYYGIGENYLAVTRRAADTSTIEARRISEGIEAVLNQTSRSFEFEYPCHSPTAFRWFMVNVSRLTTSKGGAVVWHTDITRRREVEEALRQSEERFRQFAENSTNVFWIMDAKRRLVEYLNPAHEAIWGEARELIQADPERWEHLVHPADRDRVRASLPILLSGENHTVEYRIIRPVDKAVRWIRDTGFPIRDDNGQITRVAGVAEDITKDKEATAALGVTQERFKLLVEGAREYAMFLLDPSNVITYWSKGAERIFGWRAEEAVGRSGELIFTPEQRAIKEEEKEIGIALRKGTAPDKRWHMCKDGSRIWVDGVMRRLDDEETGALRGFAKIARDATEQRAAQDELRRAQEDLEQRVQDRTKELQAMNETLENEMMYRQKLERDILQVTERERARISQDLHDSLCQELTATAFLLKSKARKLARESPEAGVALNEGAQVVNRNAGLARDLARGLHPLELGSGGLVSALRELASRTSETVTCRCECPRSLRLPVETVAVNLYRIAQEAVTNALKHARATEIVICIEREKGDVTLSITDNGKGIRGVRGRKGLGLNIMRYRANVAGGDLTVEPRRGRGTRIVCVVPVKP